MIETLLKRIEELGAEATKLMHRKNSLQEAIEQGDIRMHQISGAITELDAIINGEKYETSKIDG